MPGMSGLELLTKLKQLSPETVGILLSGNTYAEDVARAMEQGIVFRLLEKPCSPTDLTEALMDALHLHEQPST
jgi:DNA-binding NtrC family response regulator